MRELPRETGVTRLMRFLEFRRFPLIITHQMNNPGLSELISSTSSIPCDPLQDARRSVSCNVSISRLWEACNTASQLSDKLRSFLFIVNLVSATANFNLRLEAFLRKWKQD